VDERHGSSAIQLAEQRLEALISQVDPTVVREQADAVRAKPVQGVASLLQGRVDVGEGKNGEEAEAAWVARDRRGSLLVERSGQLSRLSGVREGEAGGAKGEKSRGDPWRRSNPGTSSSGTGGRRPGSYRCGPAPRRSGG
jgi:hypothetical protein